MIEDKLQEAVVGLEEIRRVCLEALEKVKVGGIYDRDTVEGAFHTLKGLGYVYTGTHWRHPHHDLDAR